MQSSFVKCPPAKEILLRAISVFSVPLWLTNTASSPRRHREHRDCTEKNLNTFDSIENREVAGEFFKRLL
jgi:hypothetical protein